MCTPKLKINQHGNENLIWHVNAKMKPFIPLNKAAAAATAAATAAVAAAACLQIAERADED